MTSYNLLGTDTGNESVYDYTRRRWAEMRENLKQGRAPGVTNDKAGAYAASRLIFVELSKNPGLVTDGLPPAASYVESIINNPSNPIAWLTQKAGQAVESTTHAAAVNLDKPASFLQSAGKALPWYTKPGFIVAILAATVIVPPLMGKSLEGLIRGFKAKAKGTMRRSFTRTLRR